MSDSSNIKSIFSETGCLTLHGMRGHLERTHPKSDASQVKSHLKGCELCTEAIAGVDIQPVDAIVLASLSEITDKIKSRSDKRRSELAPVPAAAIIAAATFVLVFFSFLAWKFQSELIPGQQDIAMTNRQDEVVDRVRAKNEISALEDQKKNLNKGIAEPSAGDALGGEIEREGMEDAEDNEFEEAPGENEIKPPSPTDKIIEEEAVEKEPILKTAKPDGAVYTENVNKSGTYSKERRESNRNAAPSNDLDGDDFGEFDDETVADFEATTESIENPSNNPPSRTDKKLSATGKKSKVAPAPEIAEVQTAAKKSNTDAYFSTGPKTVNGMMDAGMEKYNAKNYTSASNYFMQVVNKEPRNSKARYHLAMCYVAMGSTGSALTHFNVILGRESDGYFSVAEWQKANTLLKSGQSAQAKALLQKIAGSGSKYKLEAEGLLNSLD